MSKSCTGGRTVIDLLFEKYAAELVTRSVDVIVATGGYDSIMAAKAATKTIPIVFSFGADPIAAGFVDSAAKPNGNLTGATLLAENLEAKRLELLATMLPDAKRFALLIDPTRSPAANQRRQAKAASKSLKRRCFYR